MKRPDCNNLLIEKQVIEKPYRIDIDECIKCGGLWFDANELEKYRASILSTSEYTVLPEFELIPAIDPNVCCRCEQKWGFLESRRYLIHGRDTKFCQSFCKMIESGGVKTVKLSAHSPNLNAYSERWVRSVKEECLSNLRRIVVARGLARLSNTLPCRAKSSGER